MKKKNGTTKTSVNVATYPRLIRFRAVWPCVCLGHETGASPVCTSQSDFGLAKHFKENTMLNGIEFQK